MSYSHFIISIEAFNHFYYINLDKSINLVNILSHLYCHIYRYTRMTLQYLALICTNSQFPITVVCCFVGLGVFCICKITMMFKWHESWCSNDIVNSTGLWQIAIRFDCNQALCHFHFVFGAKGLTLSFWLQSKVVQIVDYGIFLWFL